MSPTAVERPRLLVVAGPNGAGKTTITEAGLAHQWFGGCEYVNPDQIAQHEFGDWNDPHAVLEAARLATERRETCLREGRSLAFETVFSSPDGATGMMNPRPAVGVEAVARGDRAEEAVRVDIADVPEAPLMLPSGPHRAGDATGGAV